ncbi:MAG: hybrid sensor histidine kinase/response regulator [Bacteroidetes bacterium]|nr:MAG: hybrid sensor histidine kinase/response regulator [Bacteroidota bacterium]
MDAKEKEFQKKLLATFRIEAEEHLKHLANGLLELEKQDSDNSGVTIESVFREVHSLKGAARAVNLRTIEKLCQSLESVFSAMKKGEISPMVYMFDIFHSAVNQLSDLLLITDSEVKANILKNIDYIISCLSNILKFPGNDILFKKPADDKSIHDFQEVSESAPGVGDFQIDSGYLRISAEKLNSLMLQAQELQSVKLQNKRKIDELAELNALIENLTNQTQTIKSQFKLLHYALTHKEFNIDEKSRKEFDGVMSKLSGYFDWSTDFIKNLDRKIRAIQSEQIQNGFMFGIMADKLLEDMKIIQLLKFSSLLEIFPKMLRDLARDKGKDAILEISGAEFEIDRRILEEIKDPLIHIIRNCIDHGIESPIERKQKGKPEGGLIKINISQKDADKIEIEISDDGSGIDLNKVKVSAIKIGLSTQEELNKLNREELTQMIFLSGVSTSQFITDLSGRGLGLSIVREKIENLNGEVNVESFENKGTTFKLILPVTTSTIGGLIIKECERQFVIPSIYIDSVIRLKKSEIKSIENQNMFKYSGKFIPIVKLAEIIKIPGKTKLNGMADALKIVVLNSQQKKIGLQVDEVVNEQEIIVKELGKQLARVMNIYGATTTGSRDLILILNIPDLVKSTVSMPEIYKPQQSESEEEHRHKKILVVEDSITARTLLKGILETSGFTVGTAVDGLDAITKLKGESFDMVISDIDMPNMNGFLLTEKIRSDNKLSDLPVVLVTSLDSRSDRERGIDVGANAYIVKSSFDESNLIDVVKRLI